jgi:hypothetical protein
LQQIHVGPRVGTLYVIHSYTSSFRTWREIITIADYGSLLAVGRVGTAPLGDTISNCAGISQLRWIDCEKGILSP